MIHTAPKPVQKEKAAPKYLKRTSWGVSTKPRKPLAQSGQTKAKKAIRQKAFYASAVWKRLRKSVLERAENQCEFELHTTVTVGGPPYEIQHDYRCPVTIGLQVHHAKGSSRFGGNELPEDLTVLCRYHHELIEARLFPTRHRTHGRGA